MRHPLQKKGKPVLYSAKKKLAGIQWPTYTGTATEVGISSDGRTAVYYDPSLGAQGLVNAQDLLSLVPQINSFNDSVFGVSGGKVNVIVFALGGATDGTGGADHDGCTFGTGGNIELDATFTYPGTESQQTMRLAQLYCAELSENYMNGNQCGYSCGESVSRWCAEICLPDNELGDFSSAPVWQQDGYANWVDQYETTDQDYDSIGCGMAFLSWMIHEKGLSFSSIAQKMVNLGDNTTWAGIYESLSGSNVSPWSSFLSAVQALGSINSDDPFAGDAPAPVPTPTPTPTPVPGKTYANWLNDLAGWISANPAVPDSLSVIGRKGGEARKEHATN